MKKAKQSIKLILTTQLFLALSVLIGHAQTPESVDSLLHCIDEAIDHSAQYVSRKEQRIRQLQQQLSQAKNLHAEYQLSYRLYEEYTPFVNDSAIIYLKRCIKIARKTGRHSEVGKCQALIAIRCSSSASCVLFPEPSSPSNTMNFPRSVIPPSPHFQMLRSVYTAARKKESAHFDEMHRIE